MSSEWKKFRKQKGSSQDLPEERKAVLVTYSPVDDSSASIVACGYLRYSAGDKESPYFVVPGIGGDPISWCDCIDGFDWFGFSHVVRSLETDQPRRRPVTGTGKEW